MIKRSLRLWLGISLGGFLLYLFLRGANFTLVINNIRDANYLLIGPSFGLALLVYLVRAYRWKFLLLPLKETRLTNLFTTTIIGYMVNSLIPGRLGELVRPYLLGHKEDPISFASSVSQSKALGEINPNVEQMSTQMKGQSSVSYNLDIYKIACYNFSSI